MTTITAPLTDEAGRLAALRSYGLLDTAPEQAFDELAALAAQLCGASVSLISLIDEGREWFKAKVGVAVNETAREVSFGALLLGWPGLFVVPDASLDARFAENPLVTGPSQLRFYAAMPLITAEGKTLGALCVMDQLARELTTRQQEALGALSRQVMAQLELRLATQRTRLGLAAVNRADEALRLQQARMLEEREQLLITEERMRFALEHSEVGIWDMDYATGMLSWSERLEAQYGLRPGAFDGTFPTYQALIHPDDRVRMSAVLEKAMATGADFKTEHRVRWADGTVRFLAGAGRILLDEKGKATRGVGISMDVTERRNLENQYHQAQKMEAIGQLAAGVAHDFNNILTAILGYCEVLLDEPDQGHSDDIEEIRSAGLRAAGLTRQLLDFSRKQIIEPTVIDVNALLTKLRPMLERIIGESVTVVLSLAPSLRAVKVDRGQLEQVVMNLAVNARDAMPDCGTLTLETSNAGDSVVLTVRDTGTGMTPEVQARVFEPFFTTKEVGKGTGLGLATVHGIVARSGGTVKVVSEPDHGSSFELSFPGEEVSTPLLEDAPKAKLPGGTESVLVVEDEEVLRRLTKRLLERKGYRVVVAANAVEARRLFEQNPSIEVVLSDVVMPGLSGPALARQLSELRPGLKVVFMSGYTEGAISHHGVLDAGVAFLHKPFSSETLGRKLREVLDAA